MEVHVILLHNQKNEEYLNMYEPVDASNMCDVIKAFKLKGVLLFCQLTNRKSLLIFFFVWTKVGHPIGRTCPDSSITSTDQDTVVP